MRRRKKTVLDDSESSECSESSESSDATVYNPKTSNNRKTVPSSNRGRQARRQNAKRQRVLDDSDRDTSPQPGPSGLNNNRDSSDDSRDNTSESESIDSDYEHLVDRRKKRKPPIKETKAKKQKANKKPVNGVSSQKRTGNSSQQNTSNRKQSTSNGVTLDVKHVESLAQKLVYFLLVEDQKKYAIKRKAITTHVFKDENYSPKLYNAVIKKANSILKKIYGMELMAVENQKDSYLIVNILRRELGIDEYVEVPKLKQQQHGLILYLLTVIFMNDNAITEDDLTKCLKPLGIDLTSKKLHPIFGDVKKYITTELVKQMYLSYELISKEPMRYEITWGIRAKQEFDKRDLLQFACQIMDDTTPESWRIQFQDATMSANPQVNGNS